MLKTALLKATIFVVFVTLVSATCGEAMVLHFTLDQMIEEADIIFAGVVTDQQCRYGPNGTMIFTDVSFQVERLIFTKDEYVSASEGMIVLTFAGGEIDGKNIRIPDVPSFKTGERYLIFSRMDGKTYVSPVIGSFQGVFHVITDEITGEAYPLYAAKKPIVEVNDKGLHLGPSISRIRGGEIQEAPDILHPLRYNVAPQNAAKTGKATAFISKHKREIPAKLMNLNGFENEIQERIKLRKG